MYNNGFMRPTERGDLSYVYNNCFRSPAKPVFYFFLAPPPRLNYTATIAIIIIPVPGYNTRRYAAHGTAESTGSSTQ
jgi:hypothetical protein